jgi:competence protein ComEA
MVAAAAGRIEAGEATSASLVDLNRATAAQLAELPGIGEAKAAAIVAYRVESGAFRSVDDLEQVRGIGPALVGKLRPLVKLGGPVRTGVASPGSVKTSGSGLAPSKPRSLPAGSPAVKK